MTAQLKPYPEYKASGIDWLGEIPSHWKTVRVGLLFNAKAGGDAKPEIYSENADERHPFPVYTNSAIENQIYAYSSEAPFSEDSITVSGRGDIGHAFLRKGGFDAIIRLVVLTPTQLVDLRYYTYFIDTVIPFFSDSAAVGQLSAQQISKYLLGVPPLAEQEAIAGYLDEMTGKIDTLISEKTAQVEELRAYRSSLITETVTHGLNSDAPLRDSGIDWLGQIPQHWSESKFKYFLYQITTPSFQDKKIALENIESGTGRFIVTESEFDGNGIAFCRGDIIYGKLRPYLRKVWLAEFDGNAIGDFFVYRTTEKCIGTYMKWVFLSSGFTSIVNQSTDGAKMPRVSSDFIKDLVFFLPPLSEQQEIAVFLDEKTSKIDRLINELTKQLDELAEYKQAIITEAVTGKVDVRDYKPKI